MKFVHNITAGRQARKNESHPASVPPSLLSRIRSNWVCLLSFAIPFLIMLTIFIINGIFPFGDESFMHSDMYHQYVPFLSEMLSKLRNNESLGYSWNVGVGTNFLALYAYYMASPFNWLVVLFPDQYLIEFMSYLVILKIGFCGFTFAWYLTRHFKTRSVAVVPFAVFYAMSGYLAAYNWNVMWLDCIFLFPLIALGLEKLVTEGKYKLYCISFGLCILSNYYISIMVCIFLVLYFLVLLLTKCHTFRHIGKAILRFALFSALAGGMAAILLIPEYSALHLTKFSDINFPSKLTFYFSTIDMLARHCMDVAVETGLDHWPNIYCGVAVFLLVPLYIANGKISLRDKALRIGLLAFMLVSFSANMLNFIWHGMNYPDSLPCRQSFMYIFLLLTLCCEAILRIRECSYKALGVSFCLSLGFVLLCEKLIDNEEAFPVETFLLTAAFLCLYGIFLYYYKKRNFSLKLLAVLTLLAVTTEASVNMYQTSVSVTSRSKYLENHDNYRTLVERIQEQDPDFYRFEKFSRVTKNDGTMIGYPTASLFSSTANGHVEEFYEKLGMSHSKVFYCFDGATPFTSSLLSVRYMFSKSSQEDPNLYTLIDSEGDIYLYECKYTLPLGFMVSNHPGFNTSSGNSQTASGENGDGTAAQPNETETENGGMLDEFLGNIEDTQTDVLEKVLDREGSNPVETQNLMVRALGLDEALFTGVGTQEDGSATTITVEQSGHYYAYVNNGKVDTLKMESESLSKSFTKLKYRYICDLGWHDEGDVISLHSEDSSSLSLSAYRLDETVMARAIDILSQETMTVDSFDSTHIKGHIDVSQTGELLLSVPYEPGWKIRVDGEEVQAGLFDDTFISLSLEPGAHTIEMHYSPTGFALGIVISLLSLAAFILIVVLERRRRLRLPGSGAPAGQAMAQPDIPSLKNGKGQE